MACDLSDIDYGFGPAEAPTCLERWMASPAGGSVRDGWVRAELEDHVREENSTFTWLLEPMIERAGFVIDHAEYSDDQIFARYFCTKEACG